MASLWILFTLVAAGGQTLRNALQRELTTTLGTVGATHVRFLYGLPFGLLFLGLVLMVSRSAPPALNAEMLTWTFVGAVAQIIATALLLAAMQEKSFVVATALSKTEPVHVAIFGMIVLGDRITWSLGAAILIATAGVMLISWPKTRTEWALRPVLFGLVSAAFFGLSAIGFRRGILALDAANFFVDASTTLVVGLAIQVTLLTTWLAVADRATLWALFRAWRPSVKAGFMGAFASQMWFCAFALQSAAMVRTLALVEVLYAQLISRNLFKQSLASREAAGIALIIIGVVILLQS